MVIAIDGPAGSGKSTTAKAVAATLGFAHLDTGAMYRAVALASLERGLAPAEAAAAIRLEPGPPLLVDGEAPGELLRSPEVTAAASGVAGDPEVRALLVARQREILADGDWVAEGRDICTVVAPDAEVRIWLFADAGERARRRAVEQGLDPAEVLEAQRLRDTADSGHGRSTLEAAEGATRLDTTGLTVEEVVERIRAMAEAARG
jgi:cytidylate kinase